MKGRLMIILTVWRRVQSKFIHFNSGRIGYTTLLKYRRGMEIIMIVVSVWFRRHVSKRGRGYTQCEKFLCVGMNNV